jgi:hypothetical protein
VLRHLIPRRLRYQLRGAQWALRNVRDVQRRFGWRTAAAFVTSEPWVALRVAVGSTSVETFDIPVPDAPPVTCRAYSSDREVFLQTLAWGMFDWFERSHAPLRVIDCGANIGTATLAILDRCPNATVVALEPDVIGVRGALWPVPGAVVFDPEPFRDDRQWTIHVKSAGAGQQGDVDAYDIPALMQKVGWDRIDLLKMDIEGAETSVLQSAGQWLGSVGCLAVELHDEAAAVAFRTAVGDRFSVSRHGELTIARQVGA